MTILPYKLKTLLLVLLSTICVETSMAQISFSYDANGNRTAKEIVLSSMKNEDFSDSENVDKDFSIFDDKIGDMQIKIYPNPTKRFLRVDIQNSDSDISGHIEILSNIGKTIYKTSNISLNNQINLSDQPHGVYVMRINLNGYVSVWKIIKE